MYLKTQIQNGEVSYYTLGEGKPIILLNGFSGTFLHWDQNFLDHLSKTHKVYCINYRGVGYSTSIKEDISIFSMAEDVSQFMNALSLEKSAVLGYSMGGYVAQEFAFKFSTRLSSLYLVSTNRGGKNTVSCSEEAAKEMAPRDLNPEERIQVRLNLNFPKVYHEQMRPIQKKWVEQYNLPECRLNLEMLNKQSHAIKEWRESFSDAKLDQYTKIKIPTFIFSGLKDRIIPYQNSIHLGQMITRSQITLFEDGGHGLLSQYGIEIAQSIS